MVGNQAELCMIVILTTLSLEDDSCPEYNAHNRAQLKLCFSMTFSFHSYLCLAHSFHKAYAITRIKPPDIDLPGYWQEKKYIIIIP
jgi:hypothetical protein